MQINILCTTAGTSKINIDHYLAILYNQNIIE